MRVSNKRKIKHGETEETKGAEKYGKVVRYKRLLDQPTVGVWGAAEAAVVTLPAATLPAGKEHLPVEQTLILLP